MAEITAVVTSIGPGITPLLAESGLPLADEGDQLIFSEFTLDFVGFSSTSYADVTTIIHDIDTSPGFGHYIDEELFASQVLDKMYAEMANRRKEFLASQHKKAYITCTVEMQGKMGYAHITCSVTESEHQIREMLELLEIL